MQEMPKRVVIGSMVVAAVVALAAIADLVMGVPFSGSSHTKLMDILFIVAAGITIYMGWNAYRDLT
jgi:hypothetical protein